MDATIGGAIIGAAFSGKLCDYWGRKRVMIAGDILFTFGSVVCGEITFCCTHMLIIDDQSTTQLLAVSNGFAMLVVGRVIVGFAIGFASHTTPVYLSELAPSHIRGRVVSAFNASIVAGQV